MSDLRNRLKAETAGDHARLDEAMGAHDLATRPGLAAYLGVNHLALTCLQPLMGAHGNLPAPCLPLPELRGDLAALGEPLPAWTDRPRPDRPHPLGLIYVIAGSSLGASVLHGQWTQSTDRQVKSAGRFLEKLRSGPDWRAFLHHMSHLDTGEPENLEVIRSARVGFDVFYAAHQQLLGGVIGQTDEPRP